MVLAVVFVGFSVAFWWDALLEVGPHQVRGGDQSQWLRMAVNLHRHHTFSKDMVPKGGGVRPTAYREPVYPAFVAAQMALNPSLRDLDAQQVYNEGDGHPALVALQVPQILIMYATILLAMGIVWKLSGSAVFALGAGIVIALSTTLQREMLIYRSETLAVFLTTALAFVLVVAAERRSPAAYAGAGALAGLLALTKAVFGYFWLPFVLVFALVAWRAGWKRRPAVMSGAAFVLAFGVVIAPWMARNYFQFGRWYIADRGGIALNLRTLYDSIDPDEYFASFFYWTPYRTSKQILEKHFDYESYRRLNRRDREHGFYLVSRENRRKLTEQLGDPVLADRVMLDEAVDYVIHHPVRHLALSLPLGLRGIFVEKKLNVVNIAGYKVATLAFASFATLCVIAVKRSDLRLAGALLPALHCWGFYSLASHNLPRYNMICIPTFYLAILVLVGAYLWPLAQRWGVQAAPAVRTAGGRIGAAAAGGLRAWRRPHRRWPDKGGPASRARP